MRWWMHTGISGPAESRQGETTDDNENIESRRARLLV
jgi:hypothetical protein